ncbi:MAG: excinuclease ABC subunit UvrC [Oscillospiraceae bacterium]|nr:excinuclease ABC subunit UvrC [Oscillospiraceae bacterium]
MNPRLSYLQEKTAVLTTEPGIYIMKNEQEKILYIGKAKNLRNRVTSYFRDHPDHTPKTAKMVSQVYDYDFIVTGSEYEALILECSLIKQHKPPYNILLKDDKGYHYIRISPPPFSRITAEVQNNGEGEHLGPYMSGFVTKQTVNTVNRLFQLPTCGKSFPAAFRKQRPCLNYHIGQCMGVCRGTVPQQQYAQTVADAVQFIKSGGDHTVTVVEQRMYAASERLDFEEAAKLRDRISAIRRAGESQDIVDAVTADTDVIGMAQSADTTVISVLMYREGRLYDQSSFYLSGNALTEHPLDEFLPQYYSSRIGRDLPRTILLEHMPAETELLSNLLRMRAGHAVALSLPQKGIRHRLLLRAKQNASEKLSLQMGRTGKELLALEELGRVLGLKHPPLRIEAYDISNLSSAAMVAGMIVFENGRPLKSAYRRFSIRELEMQNDYAAMQEVIHRRLTEYQKAQQADPPADPQKNSFAVLPDLILLDGGKGHVSAIAPILEEMQIRVPLFGMVKDDKHRTRAIATNGGELSLRDKQAAFALLTRIQDEVHRYSVQYMKTKHKKSSYALTLTKVKGIGEKKAQQLLLTYKTRAQLKAASPEALAKTAGVNMETARVLHQFISELPDD